MKLIKYCDETKEIVITRPAGPWRSILPYCFSGSPRHSTKFTVHTSRQKLYSVRAEERSFFSLSGNDRLKKERVSKHEWNKVFSSARTVNFLYKAPRLPDDEFLEKLCY